MPITIASNIASLGAQRQLGRITEELGLTHERLSSGMRINRAADDAAGLAIASSLNANQRVYTTALRNISDGISSLSIAQGALDQLSTLTLRQAELAEQSANGVYSVTQRQAMQKESDALVDEYNRIVSTTTFNGQRVIDGSYGDVRIQAGYGLDESLALNVGDQLARKVGQGEFNQSTTVTMLAEVGGIVTGDLNRDGRLDLVSAGTTTGGLSVSLGIGDGTFLASTSIAVTTITNGDALELYDVNNDGNLDYIVSSTSPGVVSVGLGNGDGTFQASLTFDVNTSAGRAIAIADYDGDNVADIAVAASVAGYTQIWSGNGNGSFRYGTSFNHVGQSLITADMNLDGHMDLVSSGISDAVVMYGRGDGSFGASQTIVFTAAGGDEITAADINRDGRLDLVHANNATAYLSIWLGDAQGTFGTSITLSTGTNTNRQVEVTDINGDGLMDIFVGRSGGANRIGFFLGNGNGTFTQQTSLSVNGSEYRSIAVGDYNNDGVIDIASGLTGGSIAVLIANTEDSNSIGKYYILTQVGARSALDEINHRQEKIAREMGVIGALQSRLLTTSSVVRTNRDMLSQAMSVIRDADIAQETASATKLQILQQVATSVLAQTQTLPDLALNLLRG